MGLEGWCKSKISIRSPCMRTVKSFAMHSCWGDKREYWRFGDKLQLRNMPKSALATIGMVKPSATVIFILDRG